MTKKSKIRITVLAIVLLLVFGFLWTFNFNPLIPAGFLMTLPANQEQREMYINSYRKSKKVKKPLKASCANPRDMQIKTSKNAVNTVDSDGYRKMRGYINDIERAANALKTIQTTYDIFGDANPDAVREILPFLIEKFYEDIMALPKEADYAMIDAMCDPSLEWETKFWLSQILGDRNGKEALPLFREMAGDENEPFGLRVSVIDQIRSLRDRDASNLMVELLDNNDDIIRDKASATLRDTTELGDEYIYNTISSHYYTEKDANVKECLLGSMIVIGGEQALPEVREILKTATRGEKDNIAILLENVRSDASVELLKEMYDPQNENFSNLILGSLAKLEVPEANEFLYGIIEEVNGGNSVMAASYLVDQHNKEVIPYIEQALERETNEKFIRCYRDMLSRANK